MGKVAVVERSIFPDCAPVFVLRGSVDCPLHADSRGSVKAAAAPKRIQGYAPFSREPVWSWAGLR
ncbi:hypothetical protein [Brevibacillus borstelensis]|uniref:hypothetical protein n=1 Tax=Brevibacillus borstelensis TaxID=45462 RepID=UPI0030BFE154